MDGSPPEPMEHAVYKDLSREGEAEARIACVAQPPHRPRRRASARVHTRCGARWIRWGSQEVGWEVDSSGLLAGEEVARLAARLAAARCVHLFLERVEADGAHHDIVSHDVARRSIEPERVRELEALLDGGLDLVARHIFFDPRDIESRLFRSGKRARLVRLVAAAEQLLMELEILLAMLILHTHHGRYMRCLD